MFRIPQMSQMNNTPRGSKNTFSESAGKQLFGAIALFRENRICTQQQEIIQAGRASLESLEFHLITPQSGVLNIYITYLLCKT